MPERGGAVAMRGNCERLAHYWDRLLPQWTLKIDVDGKRRPSLRVLVARLARAGVRVSALVERPSPSGRGWHRWLNVQEKLTPTEIVALQAICGSDVLREAYCFQRARAVQAQAVRFWWRTRWNVLYKKAGRE